jgi:hypothetical protein
VGPNNCEETVRFQKFINDVGAELDAGTTVVRMPP